MAAVKKVKSVIARIEQNPPETGDQARIYLPLLQLAFSKFNAAHDELAEASEPESPEEAAHAALGEEIEHLADKWQMHLTKLMGQNVDRRSSSPSVNVTSTSRSEP